MQYLDYDCTQEIARFRTSCRRFYSISTTNVTTFRSVSRLRTLCRRFILSRLLALLTTFRSIFGILTSTWSWTDITQYHHWYAEIKITLSRSKGMRKFAFLFFLKTGQYDCLPSGTLERAYTTVITRTFSTKTRFLFFSVFLVGLQLLSVGVPTSS